MCLCVWKSDASQSLFSISPFIFFPLLFLFSFYLSIFFIFILLSVRLSMWQKKCTSVKFLGEAGRGTPLSIHRPGEQAPVLRTTAGKLAAVEWRQWGEPLSQVASRD